MLNINEFKSVVNKYDLERPNLFVVQFGIPPFFSKKVGNLDYAVFKSLLSNGKTLSLLCRSANMPGRGLAVADTRRHGIGPNLKMPFSSNIEDLNLTFYNDGDSRAYMFFTVWLEYILSMSAGAGGSTSPDTVPGVSSSYQLRFRKEYETNLELITLGGEKGKYQGSGILSSIVSIASAKFGVPFVGSLLNSLSGPEFELKERRRIDFRKVFPTYLSGINYNHSSSDTISEFSVNFSFQNYKSSYKFA